MEADVTEQTKRSPWATPGNLLLSSDQGATEEIQAGKQHDPMFKAVVGGFK